MYGYKRYLSFGRLAAYVEQFKYVSDNDIVLEIGKGAGIFHFMASTVGECYSPDVEKELKPDYAIDITNKNDCNRLPKKFNKIFCCQVLEHVPFEKALQGLQNILTLEADIVCISIPDNRKYFRIGLKLPKIKFNKVLSIPFTGKRVDIQNHGAHHWEIYSGNLREVMKEIRKTADRTNYRISDNYRLYERPSQHFIIFERCEE